MYLWGPTSYREIIHTSNVSIVAGLTWPIQFNSRFTQVHGHADAITVCNIAYKRCNSKNFMQNSTPEIVQCTLYPPYTQLTPSMPLVVVYIAQAMKSRLYSSQIVASYKTWQLKAHYLLTPRMETKHFVNLCESCNEDHINVDPMRNKFSA